MSQPPAPRYRVVERDRRLIVIDTWERERPESVTPRALEPVRVEGLPGEPLSLIPTQSRSSSFARERVPPFPLRNQRSGSDGIRRVATGIFDFEYTGFDGRGVLTTTRWIDNKGPRAVALDSGSADMINGILPVLLVGVAVLVGLAVFMHPIVPVVLLFGLFAKRAQLRAKFTAWLDAIESEMSLSAATTTEADTDDPY